MVKYFCEKAFDNKTMKNISHYLLFKKRKALVTVVMKTKCIILIFSDRCCVNEQDTSSIYRGEN